MLELNSFVFTHVQVRSISALPPRRWNVREVVKKKWQQKRFGCFTVNWVFIVCLNFQPRVISCPPSHLYLVNISQFLPYLPVYLYFSGIYLSFCLHAHKLLSFFFPRICFHFLLSLPGPMWFNLVSEAFLKARAGKEFNISFSAVMFFTVCGLTAGWLTINQASCALTPSPWVGKSALAECNILKWPSAEWLIKFTSYGEIFFFLLKGLLVFTLCSMFNSERLFSPEKFTVVLLKKKKKTHIKCVKRGGTTWKVTEWTICLSKSRG